MNGCSLGKIISIDSLHTFFKSDFKKNYVFKGEKHNFWEIVFVTDGTVGITAEEEIFVLGSGQAVIHKPDEFHKIWSEFDTNPTVIVLSFDASVFPKLDGRVFHFDSSSHKKLEEVYEMSFKCFEREGIKVSSVKPNGKIDAEFIRLQLELLILSLVHKQETTARKGVRSAEIFASAVKIMEDSPDAGYCIDDIAAMCSISPAYLKKIFVKYTGCSVMQYYSRLRARIACGYLDNGRSVKETALLLGFNDQNYFSTFFKRVMGMSPTDFRKNIKK